MQKLVNILLLSVLLCSLLTTSTAQKSGRKTHKQPPSSVICKIESVPNGMVVVGYKHNSACSAGAELVVKRPENGDIICAESPVPSQFSITSEAQGVLVGTCPTKAFLIEGGSASVATASSGGDDTIARAFANQASGAQVEGEGTVIRVLPDDMNGSRHQKFIIQLASGQTLLFAHNIDIAPRVDGLQVGDNVSFNGEYIWNAKGGVVHWTHHDPQRRHTSGWIKHNGRTYQ
ncbi:MAG TPA: DUF3465 domain-containing protein [Pyrinomonadaceae bacterium]|jgi:hypothetical protein|nr:DUF3465 domain-containing protein [Pyrinomonadaceae bacterium]